MKTAEEWIEWEDNLPIEDETSDVEILKMVQVDALREACEIASNAVGSANYSTHYHCAAMIIRDAIEKLVKEIEQ